MWNLRPFTGKKCQIRGLRNIPGATNVEEVRIEGKLFDNQAHIPNAEALFVVYCLVQYPATAKAPDGEFSIQKLDDFPIMTDGNGWSVGKAEWSKGDGWKGRMLDDIPEGLDLSVLDQQFLNDAIQKYLGENP